MWLMASNKCYFNDQHAQPHVKLMQSRDSIVTQSLVEILEELRDYLLAINPKLAELDEHALMCKLFAEKANLPLTSQGLTTYTQQPSTSASYTRPQNIGCKYQ